MYKENSEDILKRMLKDTNTSNTEGTLIYDALSPVSKELKNSYEKLEEILNKVFPQNAYKTGYSEALEESCLQFGIEKKRGRKASGIATITGISGTKIPSGFIVRTKSNLQYKTLSDAIITNSIVDVGIEAIKIGTDYNVQANNIVEMQIQLVGITSIINKEKLNNGIDEETNEQLYNRLLLKMQTPATSGNANNYLLWALEINGIGDARVFPLWNGNGTVKVVVASTDKRAVTQEIINNVKQNIEDNRPVGADVSIFSIKEFLTNISVDIQKDTNVKYEEVKESIASNIEKYLKSIALKENLVRYTRIANCVLDAEGVIDYSNLKMNNSTSNIALNDEQVAVLGSVVVNNAT